MPSSIRIENPFSFLAAPDFLARNASNNNIHADSLGVLFTLSVGDLTYFERNRLLNECEIGFSPMSQFHSSRDAPPSVKVFPFFFFFSFSSLNQISTVPPHQRPQIC